MFRSEFFFRTTRVRIFIFFVAQSANFFLQNLTLDYMTKTLNQIIFFFLHQNQNIFFSNIGNQNIFLEIRRLTTIAVETFKIIHKQSPSYLHDLISIKDQKYNFRHQGKAVLPRVRTTRYGLNSFRYNAAQI